VKGRDRQFGKSLLAFAVSVSVFLAGLYLLVLLTGPAGCVVLFGAAGAFLWWFYRGRRPDLPPEGVSARWNTGDGFPGGA
jgi:hypothetical protein